PWLLSDAMRSLDEAAARLRKAARHLRALIQAVERANQALTSAKQAQTDLTGQLAEALAHQRQAHAAVAEASSRLLNAYRAWVQRLSELSPAGPDEIAEALADWCRTAEGKSPIESALNEAEPE